MALLAARLAQIDAEHMPAYLESSNPANVARYERLGFVQCGEFAVRDDGPEVTKMWRVGALIRPTSVPASSDRHRGLPALD